MIGPFSNMFNFVVLSVESFLNMFN